MMTVEDELNTSEPMPEEIDGGSSRFEWHEGDVIVHPMGFVDPDLMEIP